MGSPDGESYGVSSVLLKEMERRAPYGQTREKTRSGGEGIPCANTMPLPSEPTRPRDGGEPVTNSLSSGVMSIAPATRERPRIVTHDQIAVFERNNPALEGIGAIMLDMGIWILNENTDKEGVVTV